MGRLQASVVAEPILATIDILLPSRELVIDVSEVSLAEELLSLQR
jgi:hypothetical protein